MSEESNTQNKRKMAEYTVDWWGRILKDENFQPKSSEIIWPDYELDDWPWAMARVEFDVRILKLKDM